MTARRLPTYLLILFFVTSGCLPSSCRREEETALMPSDSLSRNVAASVPLDTLGIAWTVHAPIEYPRTIRFGPGQSDTIYVSDVERNSVIIFDTSGRVLEEIGGFDTPYLAGVRGDTVAVFSPPELSVDLVVNGVVAESITIPDADRPRASLVYAAFGEDLFYKRIGEDIDGFIIRVDEDGKVAGRIDLDAPHWRYAGLLRTWGDSLLSLSGFRPVVDVLTDDGDLDTLALRGFDSPMLARSRSFMMGDIHQAPLLSASAAAEGSYLFVMNMRPGWLQVDVFDRQGQLRARLTQPEPEYRQSFFPQDIDVRRLADGRYAIAVVLSSPQPTVRLYTWAGPKRMDRSGDRGELVSSEH